MVSRQQGKGSCLAALELAGLFLFGERLILHTAHELKTSKEAMRRLENLIKNSGERYKTTHSHGEERIEILSGPNAGARVMFQTRTKVAGLGLSIDRVIFDEAMHITPEAVDALLFTLSAMPNPQLWYTGSAVDQRTMATCETFAGIRQRALQDNDPDLCYLEWSCEDNADPTSLRERARANPGLGYRLTHEHIDKEYKSFAGAGKLRSFGLMRLGIGDWPSLGDTASIIPKDKWITLKEIEPSYIGRPVVVLYRAPEGGPWAIGAAWRTSATKEGEPSGLIHIEVGYIGADPADEVINKFVEVVTSWDTAAVIVGRGAAADEIPELESIGVEVITPNLTEEAQACGGFLNDVLAVEKLLSHSGQSTLATAISQAQKRDIPSGGFVWQASEGSAYVQLMAITLARWALVKYASNPMTGPLIAEWPDDDEIQKWIEEARTA